MARAGQLDQRVTFQNRNSASDGMGGSEPAWANFSSAPTVWAHVRPLGGGEGFENERNNAQQMARFTVRYRDDVNEGDRLLWQSVPYNIRRVDRTGGRKLYLTLEAERGATNGA